MYAAQRLTPLPLRQADGKPPGDVQDRERAKHDKEDCFVHVRITSSSSPSPVNAIKRRGELIHIMNTGRMNTGRMNTGRNCDPTATFRLECVFRVSNGLTR
jgi:hypothetical protein